MRKATPKQRALLKYLGHTQADTASFLEASAFLDMASQSEDYKERLGNWNTDKLRLHPKLYADEIAERSTDRFQEFISSAIPPKSPQRGKAPKKKRGCLFWGILAFCAFLVVSVIKSNRAPSHPQQPTSPATPATPAPRPAATPASTSTQAPTPAPLAIGANAHLAVEKEIILPYGKSRLAPGAQVTVKAVSGDQITIDAMGQTLKVSRSELKP